MIEEMVVLDLAEALDEQTVPASRHTGARIRDMPGEGMPFQAVSSGCLRRACRVKDRISIGL